MTTKQYEIEQLIGNDWELIGEFPESFDTLPEAQCDLAALFSDMNEANMDFEESEYRIVCQELDEFGNEGERYRVPSQQPDCVDEAQITYVAGEMRDLEGPSEVDGNLRVYIKVRAINDRGEEVDAQLEYNFTSEGVIIDLHIDEERETATDSGTYEEIVSNLQRIME